MRLWVQIIWLLVIATSVFGAWDWYAERENASAQAKASPRKPQTTLVLVESITLSTDKRVVRAIGTGRALQSAALFPSVSGEVIEVVFRAEQNVTSGQPLLRLDNEDQRLAVQLAQVTVDEAQRQAKRFKRLTLTGTATQALLDTANSELESARLRLAIAKVALKDRTIVAPFNGVIGLTDIDKGDRVNPETLIATLDDRSSLFVEFNVSEDAAAHIRPGAAVTMSAWTLPGRIFNGTVSAMGSRIDPTTRVLKMRALLENPDNVIRPGTSFAVTIEISGAVYPTVREVAVLWSRDGAYLWNIKQGRAQKVHVKVVRRESGRVLIDGPLVEGDSIVVEGVQGLRQGQKVTTAPIKASTS
jgi:RND family efflux transporter MFP subunit